MMRRGKMVKRKRSTQTEDAEGHKEKEKDKNHRDATGDVPVDQPARRANATQ